jgi:hypothetical protein
LHAFLVDQAVARHTESDRGGDELKRYRAARASREELDLRIRQGDYLTRESVEKAWTGRVFAVRLALLALARKLARRLANASTETIETEIRAEVRAVLTSFAVGGEATPKTAAIQAAETAETEGETT